MMKNPQLGVSAVVLFIKKKKEYFKCHFQQFLPHAGGRSSLEQSELSRPLDDKTCEWRQNVLPVLTKDVLATK